MLKLLILTLGFSLNLQSQNLDKKIYNVLVKEMKAAEKVIKQKKNARNYFRYYNSRIEMIKLKAKSIRAKKFKSNSISRNLKDIDRNQYEFSLKTKKIGDYILKKYPNFRENGKLHLMQALLVYQLDENSNEIEQHLAKSYQKNKDRNLKGLSASKLADYYFNKNKFKKASIYYKNSLKLIPMSQDRDRWLHKLSLCEFKQEKFDYAIRNLEAIFYGSKQKNDQNYYYVQARKMIPEFYAFAGKPDRGYQFLTKTKMRTPQNSLNFLRYVYSKGYFSKFDSYVENLELSYKTTGKNNELKEFQVGIYNFLSTSEYKKSKKTLIHLRKALVGYYLSHKLTSDEKIKFKNGTLSLLKKNIDQIYLSKKKEGKKISTNLLKDTMSLLSTLSYIDPGNRHSYELRKAQIYTNYGSKERAITFLENSYKSVKGQKNPKQASKLLEEIISYYDTKQVNSGKYKYYLNEYIERGNDPKVKKIAFLKLFDQSYDSQNYDKAFNLTQKFNSNYPGDTLEVETMLLKLLGTEKVVLNKSLNSKIQSLVSSNSRLKSSKVLSKGVQQGKSASSMTEINSLVSKPNSQITDAKSLEAFFNDASLDRENRFIAGYNALVLYKNLKEFSDFYRLLKMFIEKAGVKDFSEYESKLTVLTYPLIDTYPKESIDSLSYHLRKACSFKSLARSNYFEKLVELLLVNSSFPRLDKIISLGSRCEISDLISKKVGTMSLEYLDFYNSKEVKTLNLILGKDKFSEASYYSLVDKYLYFSVNKLEPEKLSDFQKVINDINKVFSGRFSTKFKSDLKKIISIGISPSEFQSMPITPSTLENFLDSNLARLAGKIDLLESINSSISGIERLKMLSERKLLSDFFVFINSSFGLISGNDTEKKEIEGIINEAISGFVEKDEALESTLLNIAPSSDHMKFQRLDQSTLDLYRSDNYEYI